MKKLSIVYELSFFSCKKDKSLNISLNPLIITIIWRVPTLNKICHKTFDKISSKIVGMAFLPKQKGFVINRYDFIVTAKLTPFYITPHILCLFEIFKAN